MPAFERGDIVKVPFPYTDRATRQFRPSLIVSGSGFMAQHGLVWVLMITSAENRGWSGDVSVRDRRRAGLPAASIARTAKIATIEAAHATKLGVLGRAEIAAVMELIGRALEP